MVLHRRAGKTALAINHLIMEAARPENADRTFWYIGPTYTQAKDIVWNDKRMLFAFLPKDLIAKKNETELSVTLVNGARIVIKGGEDPDSLLGNDPFGIVVDETQIQKPELWTRVLQPILAANSGWIWFLGTPRFKDHFYQKAVYARSSDKWQFFQLSALDSGVIPSEELEEIRRTTPWDKFRQEYLAEFLDGAGVVFRNVNEICSAAPQDPKKGHYYQIGVDLARKQDFTVVKVFDQSTQREVYQERFNQVDWSYQKARIEAIARKYLTNGIPSRIKIDATGVGDPIYQDLKAAGLNVMPIHITNQMKGQLISNMQIAFDNKSIRLLQDQVTIDELEVFEEVISEHGNSKYGAPKDFHDDTVIAAALAIWQAPKIDAKMEGGKSILMKKYRKNDNRYAPRRKEVYSLRQMS